MQEEPTVISPVTEETPSNVKTVYTFEEIIPKLREGKKFTRKSWLQTGMKPHIYFTNVLTNKVLVYAFLKDKNDPKYGFNFLTGYPAEIISVKYDDWMEYED